LTTIQNREVDAALKGEFSTTRTDDAGAADEENVHNGLF